MRATALFAGLMLALATSSPAWAKKSQAAENIDFSRISCQQFMNDLASSSEDDAAAILLWLDGYLSGVSGDTVLRFDGLEAFASNLTEYCSRRGKDRLLDAARKVGIE